MPKKTLTDTAATAVETAELPRWDLSALFPGLESPEFAEGFDRLRTGIDHLTDLFDDVGIAATSTRRSETAPVIEFERVLTALNDLAQRFDSMGSYLFGCVSTDSRNDLAQARFSQFQECAVALDKLQTRFTAWVGTLPIDELVERSSLAAEHEFPLRQMHVAARHLMSEEAEALAAELSPSSGAAWAKLHDNLTSQITAKVELEGREQTLPMSAIRNLAMEPDRDLRHRAWRSELGAWEANALPIAAALNGVKGQVLTLGARRDWADPLDESLFWSGIDRDSLDVMVEEARAAFPDFRRYLRLKARLLGIPKHAWYDVFAQVGGAYCMWLLRDESRILANYSPGYEGVTTLAHELGHAYHNLNEAGLTPLQRRTPMILAETASTFCETLVKEAALVDANRGERIYILEQSVQGACQVVVDILSRFDFEQALFAGRRERELSIGELNRLMLAAQEATYGDALAKDERHPYMWAVKGHYYSPDLSYYNYPYLFGLLFGLGLYAIYRKEPGVFPGRYDALLASTGRAGVADLAARFDIDLRDPGFWRSSLDVIRDDIDRLEELVADPALPNPRTEPIA